MNFSAEPYGYPRFFPLITLMARDFAGFPFASETPQFCLQNAAGPRKLTTKPLNCGSGSRKKGEGAQPEEIGDGEVRKSRRSQMGMDYCFFCRDFRMAWPMPKGIIHPRKKGTT